MQTLMQNSTESVSNSLAIESKVIGLLANFNTPLHKRRLLSAESGFPSWVGAGDRKLLQESKLTPDVVAALDGSGTYKTIGEAVGVVPKKRTERFVIYVKKGTYLGNVIFDKSKWNVMIYGDGKDQTIVSGSLNFVDRM